MGNPTERGRIFRRGAGLAWQWVAGEGIVLDVDRRVVRGLNAVGYRIWELLDGTRSVSQVIELLAGELPRAGDRLGADIDAFLADLVARKLIE